MLSSSLLIISLTLLAVLGVTPARAADGGIAWQGWSETAFAQAKRENRFVLLDLRAAWCHWCHVFEKIMQVQAEYLRIYALSYRELGDVRYRRSAEVINRYARTFLRSPEGAFFVSQDADVVKGRHAEAYFAGGVRPGAGKASRPSTATSTRARTAG